MDVEADVSGRSLAAVTDEAKRRIKDSAFPFEYHAEVLGEHVERQAALGALYSYLIAAAVAIVLLLQAALGSWRLAGLMLVGAPVATLGGFVALDVSGGGLSLGALVGLAAVLGLGMRQGIMQIRHLQSLEQQSTEPVNSLILRGTNERLPAVLASAITIGVIALPFALLGNIAGLEILHPAALVILGGLVTSIILTVFVVPALYPRFVPKTSAKTSTLAPEAA
jgi:Cu/Ag efflux pump CusA